MRFFFKVWSDVLDAEVDWRMRAASFWTVRVTVVLFWTGFVARGFAVLGAEAAGGVDSAIQPLLALLRGTRVEMM